MKTAEEIVKRSAFDQYNNLFKVSLDDMNWLIEQAEKVVKLEKENKINSAFKIHAIRTMTDLQLQKVVAEVKKVNA